MRHRRAAIALAAVILLTLSGCSSADKREAAASVESVALDQLGTALVVTVGLLAGVESASFDTQNRWSDGYYALTLTVEAKDDSTAAERDAVVATVSRLYTLPQFGPLHPRLLLTRGDETLVDIDGRGIDLDLLGERLDYVHAVEKVIGVPLRFVYSQPELPVPPTHSIWSTKAGAADARALLHNFEGVMDVANPTGTDWNWSLDTLAFRGRPPLEFAELVLAAEAVVPLADGRAGDVVLSANWWDDTGLGNPAPSLMIWQQDGVELPVAQTAALAGVIAAASFPTVFVWSAGGDINGRATVGVCSAQPLAPTFMDPLVVGALLAPGVLDPLTVTAGLCGQ